MKRLLPVLLVLLGTAGCGPSRVDSSTEERYERSLQAVRTSMSESAGGNLELALQRIEFYEARELGQGTGETVNREDIREHVKRRIHGMTGAEIVADARRMLEEQEPRVSAEQIQEADRELDAPWRSTSRRD